VPVVRRRGLVGVVHDDLQPDVAAEQLHDRVDADLAPASGEGEVLVVAEVLVAEEHDLALEEHLVQGGPACVVDGGHVDVLDQGPDRPGERGDVQGVATS
jgi:hypothetical protein